MSEAMEQLGRAPLFRNLGEDVLAEIAGFTHSRSLDRGEPLFQAGDPFRSFFVVNSGHIQLSRLASTGHEKVVEIIGPGETFAEAVLFMDGKKYPVDARALEATELLEIGAEGFNHLLDSRPGLTRNLLGALSKRLHQLVQDVAALTLEDATGRVVGYLLAQAEGAGGEVHLPAKKAAIASRLGIQPETFSRVLGRLREAGAIEVEGDRIRIRDSERLQEILKA
ncbi:Crp/Fnr family transcriptional regulator [Thiohalorhabdus sp. Cl-TMA]|uniref:Crp/Fnr family transcriptional regulator n=1 Tax=Thiohalorhabdus methylotrophus TaxID=3242694 RepID=A0ABV4TQK0_9GAMM